MPTQLKSDTARANGAKSHGPKTAEGRATSSRNATKHGLSSRNPVVLQCENDEDFQALHDSQMEILQPATPAEKDLVDQMVAARWRILRLQSIESGLLDGVMRWKTAYEREHDTGIETHLSAVYATEANNSRAMALASRCESRLQRTYQSAYKVLRELQAARAKQSKQPALPVPDAAVQARDCPETTRNPSSPQPTDKIFGIKPTVAIVSDTSPIVDPNAGTPKIPSRADAPARNRESEASL